MELLRFGEDFELDLRAYELRRAGRVLKLERIPMDLLLLLIERRGELVTREQIVERIWGKGVFLDTDNSINSAIRKIRQVLKDHPGQPRFVQTVTGRGYRFVSPIVNGSSAASPSGHSQPLPRQDIRFCVSNDGVRLAWSAVGSGSPLVKAANWLNHLDYEWESPIWKHWIAELTKYNRFVRYDERGNGLSDWTVKDISLEAWVQDLETVVDAAGLDRFALMGISQGGAPAITYAVRHPERVSHLILIGAYSRGWEYRENPEALNARHAFETLVRLDWGSKNPAFAFDFAGLYVPENTTAEHQEWFNNLRRVSASPENAARIMEACDKINVRALLPSVTVPTIVFHSDGDRAVPPDEGRILAAEIPNTRFVPLSSANHLLLADEPAWRVFVTELGAFLKWHDPNREASQRSVALVASSEPQNAEPRAHGELPPPMAPDVEAPIQNEARSFWSGRKRAALAALTLVLVAVAVFLFAWRKHSTGEPPSTRAMLAVLPFENLSGDAHEDYFADGLTEEMIAQLGQLQPARLGVIARTSTVRYKHTKETVAQIGRELGVDYVLEGSVRRGADRVRVTALLVRAAEQTHLWAETYERPLTDVLTIQREIAEKVTHSLSLQLLPVEGSTATLSVNLESYDKYLLGLHELGQGTRESVNKAIQDFQDAIAKDPKNARLYSALAGAYNAATTYYSSPAEVMPRAKEAALRAAELDPNLASAHVELGYVHLFFDWDWPAAEAEYRRALEINPTLPEAQLGYANYLATLGRFDEAISRVQQAYRFDPIALESRNEALWIYYYSGRTEETIEQSKRTIELEPTAGFPYAMLALAYAQLGRRTETLQAAENAIRFANSPSVITAAASALARVGQSRESKQLLNKALQQAKERYVCQFLVAATHAELGENEKALESLEQAFLQRST